MLKKIRKNFTSKMILVGVVILFEIILFCAVVFTLCFYLPSLLKFNFTFSQIFKILIFLNYIMQIITLLFLINSGIDQSYKFAWITLIVVFPIFGSLLYFLFGQKKKIFNEKKKIQNQKNVSEFSNFLLNINKNQDIFTRLTNEEQNKNALKIFKYISNETNLNIYDDPEVYYYKSGEIAYSEIIKELKKAKNFIFMEYFIISDGKFWQSILNILLEKVKNEHVDVRIIYDDAGSYEELPNNFIKNMKLFGIKVLTFQVFKPILDAKINNRDHRKILIIDGIVSFTGSINIADEYINQTDNFDFYWKDNAVKIKGEAVYSQTMLFLTQWFNILKKNLSLINFQEYKNFFPKIISESKIKKKGYVQIFGDTPYLDNYINKNTYINLINTAQKNINITTPYFIIDDEIANTLIRASKQGIKIKIIVPRISDKKIVAKLADNNYYSELIKNNIEIYRYNPGIIHMKTLIVDNIFAVISTANLDYRSLYLNFENTILLYKTDCIEDIQNDFDDCLKKSELIIYKKKRNLFLDFVKFFSVLL